MSKKPNTVALVDADQNQLIAFAKMALGLEFNGRPSADNMREMIIEAGYSKETITDLTGLSSLSQPAPAPAAGGSGEAPIIWNKDGKACLPILVHTRDGKGGDRPVPVAVNGVNILVPRGRAVPVPIPHVFALGDAVERRPIRNENGIIEGWSDVFSYPFQFMHPNDLKPEEVAPGDFEPDPAAMIAAQKLIADRAAKKKMLKERASA